MIVTYLNVKIFTSLIPNPLKTTIHMRSSSSRLPKSRDIHHLEIFIIKKTILNQKERI